MKEEKDIAVNRRARHYVQKIRESHFSSRIRETNGLPHAAIAVSPSGVIERVFGGECHGIFCA